MSGYVQRLLERGDTGAVAGNAAEGDAPLHAAGIAPVTSPLIENDQRFRIDGFDTDMLAAMLFDMPVAEEPVWTIPENPFGLPRADTSEGAGRDSPASESPAAHPAGPAMPDHQTVDIPVLRETIESPHAVDTPEPASPVTADPVAMPSPAGLHDVEPRIDRMQEPEREPGEIHYLFLRDSETRDHARPNPQPREILVERQETIETVRETVLRETPARNPDREDKAAEPPPAVSKAEPSLRPAQPDARLDTGDSDALVLPDEPLPPVSRNEPRDPPPVRRRTTETAPEAPALAPFSSAAAASVIGPLPLRPSSLTIRGWRRR